MNQEQNNGYFEKFSILPESSNPIPTDHTRLEPISFLILKINTMNQEQINITAKLYLQLAKDQTGPILDNYENILKNEAKNLCDKMFLQIFSESYADTFNFKDAIESWYKIKVQIMSMEIHEIL